MRAKLPHGCSVGSLTTAASAETDTLTLPPDARHEFTRIDLPGVFVGNHDGIGLLLVLNRFCRCLLISENLKTGLGRIVPAR